MRHDDRRRPAHQRHHVLAPYPLRRQSARHLLRDRGLLRLPGGRRPPSCGPRLPGPGPRRRRGHNVQLPGPRRMTPPQPDAPPVDVAVVGAGPAGLAAAVTAAGCGCSVTLIDSAPAVGGQIHRQSIISAAPAVSGSLHFQERLAPALRPAIGHPGIQHLPVTTVWHATPATQGFFLHLTTQPTQPGPSRRTASSQMVPAVLRARAVVVATGATELVLPFPGWDLPGVTTAGAAHALLKGQGVTVGRRVLVAGSGPQLLPVAASLAQAGVRVVAVLEATPAPEALPQAAGLAAFPGNLPEASD